MLGTHDFRCWITGLALPGLLNASHIVPRREDSANRLNPANGLCLSALHDRAFDQGLMTIREDLAVAREPTEHADFFFQSSVGAYEGCAIV